WTRSQMSTRGAPPTMKARRRRWERSPRSSSRSSSKPDAHPGRHRRRRSGRAIPVAAAASRRRRLRRAGVAKPRLCRKPRARRRAGAGHRRPDGRTWRRRAAAPRGMPDPRLDIRFNGNIIHIDLPVLTPGRIVTVYGQQEIVKDLIAARLQRGGEILFEAAATGLSGLDTKQPIIHFKHGGKDETLV